MMRLVIMVPTYNECENISLMLSELDDVAKSLNKYKTTVLVVDDNSPDGTADIAQAFILKYANLVVNKDQKLGLGKALIRGYRYAIEKLKADVVASIDADFLFDPHDLIKLIAEIDNKADVVLGSRHGVKGTEVSGWPRSRYITHWIANDFFGGWIAGNTVVKDHNANFRVIRVKGILEKVNWEELPTKGYGFLNYMIYELERIGAKFVEVKVEMKWRVLGESKVSFNRKYIKNFVRDTTEYIFMCIRIRIQRMSKNR